MKSFPEVSPKIHLQDIVTLRIPFPEGFTKDTSARHCHPEDTRRKIVYRKILYRSLPKICREKSFPEVPPKIVSPKIRLQDIVTLESISNNQ